MLDNIIDFIEDHKKLVIAGGVAVILIIVILVVRSVNLSRKAKAEEELAASLAAAETTVSALEQDTTEAVKPTSEYKSQLGLSATKADERVDVMPSTAPISTAETTAPVENYDVAVSVFNNVPVPERMVDGSSCKAYYSSVKLADFGTMWGSALTYDDFNSAHRYLVGVEKFRDKMDTTRGDLQSVGWLINNLSTMEQSDAIKFMSLHVIGSLSDNHVALLCAYDWYSAFGLKDILVVFEDMSGTLDNNSFRPGDIFSATVFAHNTKVMQVKGQNVVVCEYNVFDENSSIPPAPKETEASDSLEGQVSEG